MYRWSRCIHQAREVVKPEGGFKLSGWGVLAHLHPSDIYSISGSDSSSTRTTDRFHMAFQWWTSTWNRHRYSGMIRPSSRPSTGWLLMIGNINKIMAHFLLPSYGLEWGKNNHLVLILTLTSITGQPNTNFLCYSHSLSLVSLFSQSSFVARYYQSGSISALKTTNKTPAVKRESGRRRWCLPKSKQQELKKAQRNPRIKKFWGFFDSKRAEEKWEKKKSDR